MEIWKEQLNREEKDGLTGEPCGSGFLLDETDHVSLDHFVCPGLGRVRRHSSLQENVSACESWCHVPIRTTLTASSQRQWVCLGTSESRTRHGRVGTMRKANIT